MNVCIYFSLKSIAPRVPLESHDEPRTGAHERNIKYHRNIRLKVFSQFEVSRQSIDEVRNRIDFNRPRIQSHSSVIFFAQYVSCYGYEIFPQIPLLGGPCISDYKEQHTRN